MKKAFDSTHKQSIKKGKETSTSIADNVKLSARQNIPLRSYSILTDEATDCSLKEQLALIFRFLD